MGTSMPNETVLVVDDKPDLADLYTAWLDDHYEIRTAYGGQEALEKLDDEVDVALIDRLMPQTSGDDVLRHAQEAEYDCQIAMVTAVEPDFDIIELGFDEYIVKPMEREELVGVVESLLSRLTYDKQLQGFFALASKRAALQSRKATHELEESDVYEQLSAEIQELRSELDETTEQLTTRDFEVELRQLSDSQA
ncbi:MAG: DNA-binding response OmpR family regulator [Natronomonas sp.]|jgi:DNA-binding response OmpR family regulator|uniref:HalX domain-containing protein n=1 Tax=Natronomonas sp. TaxID=2184060 RepID=UPI0039894591